MLMFALALAAVTTSVYAKGKAPSAVLMDAKDLKWSDVPEFPGVHVAPVEGDPAKGPSHGFFKFDAGFTAPLHHHTADHYVTVISGTMVMTVDGKEHKLPPGSYFAFKNKGQHITACEKGEDCVLFMDARGKWDVIPEKK
jgi:quercetin dioxygenase-like cupin family protein